MECTAQRLPSLWQKRTSAPGHAASSCNTPPKRREQSCGGEHAISSRLQCDSELACGRHRCLSSHCGIDTQMRQRAAHLASTQCLVRRHQELNTKFVVTLQPALWTPTQRRACSMSSALPTTTRFACIYQTFRRIILAHYRKYTTATEVNEALLQPIPPRAPARRARPGSRAQARTRWRPRAARTRLAAAAGPPTAWSASGTCCP